MITGFVRALDEKKTSGAMQLAKYISQSAQA